MAKAGIGEYHWHCKKEKLSVSEKKEIYFVIWKIYFLNQNLLASIIGTEGKRKTGVNGGGCHQSGPNGWMT